MTEEELFAVLRAHKQTLEDIETRLKGVETREGMRNTMESISLDADTKESNAQFARGWRDLAEFHTLRGMIFDLAEKLGLSRAETVDEYNRRWKKTLDQYLQKFGDSNPSLAAHVDDRTEDELPEY